MKGEEEEILINVACISVVSLRSNNFDNSHIILMLLL